MTVVDSSAVIDFLVGEVAADEVAGLLAGEGVLAAPDLLVLEVLAVLRRLAMRGLVAGERARAAIDDLGDFPVELFPTLPLRGRAWELRANLTAGDAIFVALAERLAEPLATKDRGLAAAAATHAGVDAIVLPAAR